LIFKFKEKVLFFIVCFLLFSKNQTNI
jgi:hypothetical protein